MGTNDHVDGILAQWQRERPDLDLAGMAVIGRISRLARLLQVRLDEVFAEHDLASWEFDVLATLRRSGVPYALTPGQLVDSMMITSGAVTNRLDRLEARGLLTRRKDPTDGRAVLATLTHRGLALVEAAVAAHAANEVTLISSLNDSEQHTIQRLLRKLQSGVDTSKR